jgi:hypothetical protein
VEGINLLFDAASSRISAAIESSTKIVYGVVSSCVWMPGARRITRHVALVA